MNHKQKAFPPKRAAVAERRRKSLSHGLAKQVVCLSETPKLYF